MIDGIGDFDFDSIPAVASDAMVAGTLHGRRSSFNSTQGDDPSVTALIELVISLPHHSSTLKESDRDVSVASSGKVPSRTPTDPNDFLTTKTKELLSSAEAKAHNATYDAVRAALAKPGADEALDELISNGIASVNLHAREKKRGKGDRGETEAFRVATNSTLLSYIQKPPSLSVLYSFFVDNAFARKLLSMKVRKTGGSLSELFPYFCLIEVLFNLPPPSSDVSDVEKYVESLTEQMAAFVEGNFQMEITSELNEQGLSTLRSPLDERIINLLFWAVEGSCQDIARLRTPEPLANTMNVTHSLGPHRMMDVLKAVGCDSPLMGSFLFPKNSSPKEVLHILKVRFNVP